VIPPSISRPARLRATLAITLWAAILVGGFRVLVNYEVQAGAPAAAPASWPTGTTLARNADRPSLVMFAHPQCPCSRATVAELAVIMTRTGGAMNATVCFWDPDEEPAAWTQSALWRAAADIPGVRVVADLNGEIARAFGSATSGQVILFDREGRRIFDGGITGARGHAGDNRGRNLVIALARGELCADPRTPVFGCSLHEPVNRDDE
jgi:hypothetical protein